ncbi:putative membrane protein [Escherichia coli P0299917.1]|nr:putative membrane protein [Escherichia coli P0299917.1]
MVTLFCQHHSAYPYVLLPHYSLFLVLLYSSITGVIQGKRILQVS